MAANDDTTVDEKVSNRTMTPQNPPPDEFQEGGLQGWATVFGVFLVQFCGFGFASSFGVYQDYYVRIYLTNSSASTISWVGSTNVCIVSIAGIFAGRLYDKGHFYYLIWGGTLLSSFSLFMLSLAKPNQFYQVFLAQGLGLGIGAGIMYVPSLAVISHHFRRKRALAMGLVASGSSLGTVIHPILLNNTLHGKLGFANATRIEAGLITFLLIIGCLLMKTKTSAQAPAPSMGLGKCLKKFVKDKPYMIANLASTLYFLGYQFPLFYLQLDAITHGLSNDFAFYALVILSACSIGGRLAASYLVHRFDVGLIITVATTSSSAVILGMIGVKSVASVVCIAIFYGFFAGMYIALLAPLYAALSDDMSELGMRMGIGLAVAGIGVLIGPPIHGALLGDPYELHYWKPALFSGLAGVAGSALYLVMITLLRQKRRKDLISQDTITPQEEVESDEKDIEMA